MEKIRAGRSGLRMANAAPLGLAWGRLVKYGLFVRGLRVSPMRPGVQALNSAERL
jgi:hypothetical protein